MILGHGDHGYVMILGHGHHGYVMILDHKASMVQRKKEGKDQGSIHSSTTPD